MKTSQFLLSVLYAFFVLNCLLGALASSEIEDVVNNGNAIIYGFATSPPTNRGINALQVSAQIHVVAGSTDSLYEAICLYRETAHCFHLDDTVYRRPVAEHTNRNRNIAALHAFYHFIKLTTPTSEGFWGGLLRDIGYEPDDADPTTLDNPASIGYAAALAVHQHYVNDGMNMLGDHPESLFPGSNYSDTTGYSPVNSATHLRFVNRWQPQMDFDFNSRTYSQQWFMTPHMGNATSFANIADIERPGYSIKYRIPSWHPHNQAFFDQVNEVIQAQQDLTEEQKMIVEMWDNKLLGPSRLVGHMSGPGTPLVTYIDLQVVSNRANLDSFISSWAAKLKYDRVRPVSIIRNFYKDYTFLGLGAPGEGLKMIKGKEWRSYAYTDAHPEFPSGTSCFCRALTSALRHATGSDDMYAPFTLPFAAGSSFREPGVTPAQDITLGPWNKLSDLADECGESRIWGGVHFRDAVEETKGRCEEIGKRAYEKFSKIVSGQERY